MMTDRRLISISKFLSVVLRHKPEEIGLVLDENGWAELAELVRLSNQRGKQLTRQLVEEVVEKNDKQRFMVSADGTRIRANQGHSVAVNLGLEPIQPPDLLFHGTVERFLDSIRTQGLRRGNRTHVHLSADEHTARGVGVRRGPPVVLTVAARMMSENGHVFYLSQNGLWLTEHEDLGKGIRGKHFAAYSKGTNLVFISSDVAAIFPTAEAVNDALRNLAQVAERTVRSSGRAEKRRRTLLAPRRRAA